MSSGVGAIALTGTIGAGYRLALENLTQIWPNFEAVGADRVIIAGTLLNGDHRSRLQHALGNVTMSVVLVKAPQDVLETRIRARNSGRLQEDFLARTADVAKEIEAAHIHDYEIENHGRPAGETARDLLQKIDWIPAE